MASYYCIPMWGVIVKKRFLFSLFNREFSSRLLSRLVNLDSRVLLCCGLLTFAKAYGSDAENNDEGDERPSSFLQEVSRFGRTHYLVSTCETRSQTSAFAVLYQDQHRQQNSCNYDENSNKNVHNILNFISMLSIRAAKLQQFFDIRKYFVVFCVRITILRRYH